MTNIQQQALIAFENYSQFEGIEYIINLIPDESTSPEEQEKLNDIFSLLEEDQIDKMAILGILFDLANIEH